MNNVCILDCTLRDGGYINNWQFGRDRILRIVRGLIDSKVDIIECGFIRGQKSDKNSTSFASVKQLSEIIEPKNPNAMYAAMIEQHNYYDGMIEKYKNNYPDIIRLTFRKNEWIDAKNTAVQLINQGYKVCIQPVGTTNYTNEELTNLIKDVNEINPFAFYIVDTLGVMYQHELIEKFKLVDAFLNSNIRIGFHSHNNLQMSFANAQQLIESSNERQIIIDSSCFGMGRGVGNLNTELIITYLNNVKHTQYHVLPILNIIDKELMSIFTKQKWGYDLPYFLSGNYKCHPNYASYLLRKETLNIESIDKILALLPYDRRGEFDQKLIENLYISYQENQIDDTADLKKLASLVKKRPVLILGPGSSLNKEKDQILLCISKNKPMVISTNFVSLDIPCAFSFFSNEKRIDKNNSKKTQIISTSNVSRFFESSLIFSYSSLLGEGDASDNAGAMLIRLLKRIQVSKIFLAGFDGFSAEPGANYFDLSKDKLLDVDTALYKNQVISKQLRNALDNLDFEFITKTKYEI